MAASVTGTASVIKSSANSGSGSITVPADATLAVILAAYFFSAANTSTTPTINGVSATLATQWDEGDVSGHVSIWSLKNPATGTQTFAWDWDGTASANEGATFVVVYFKDTDSTTPIKSAGWGAPDTSVTGLTTGPDDITVGVVYAYYNIPSTGINSQTTITDTDYNVAGCGVAYKANSSSFAATNLSYSRLAAVVVAGTSGGGGGATSFVPPTRGAYFATMFNH